MMQINTKSPNFTARNYSYKQANKVCHIVRNEFAALSPSKMKAKSYILQNTEYYSKYMKYIHKIYPLIRKDIKKEDSVVTQFKKIIEAIKKYRVANCDDLTQLASLIFSVNGIKTQPVSVCALDENNQIKRSYMHAALAIPLKKDIEKNQKMSNLKDVIIVDPWLDITDYAPNVALKYKNMCSGYLKTQKDDIVGITPWNYKTFFKEQDFETARENFPEYIIDNFTLQK